MTAAVRPGDARSCLVWQSLRPALDHDGRLRARLNDPKKHGFKYPRATEEQLLATDEGPKYASVSSSEGGQMKCYKREAT